jgi:hypothetical protein
VTARAGTAHSYLHPQAQKNLLICRGLLVQAGPSAPTPASEPIHMVMRLRRAGGVCVLDEWCARDCDTPGLMSGTLIVWKTPPVGNEGEAARLLRGYYETGDETAFQPSEDVARFYDEVIALYPLLERVDTEDADRTPTWASTPERSDRVVSLDYSWSAPDALLRDIERLAREHRLVLYDPQGPDVSGPDDLNDEPYVPDRRETARVTLIGVAAILVAVGAWYASITVASWVVIAVAGFLALMSGYTLFVYAREARERRRS